MFTRPPILPVITALLCMGTVQVDVDSLVQQHGANSPRMRSKSPTTEARRGHTTNGSGQHHHPHAASRSSVHSSSVSTASSTSAAAEEHHSTAMGNGDRISVPPIRIPALDSLARPRQAARLDGSLLSLGDVLSPVSSHRSEEEDMPAGGARDDSYVTTNSNNNRRSWLPVAVDPSGHVQVSPAGSSAHTDQSAPAPAVHHQPVTADALCWTVADVTAWLRQLHLDQHVTAFVAASVDGKLLLTLDERDLEVELHVISRLTRKRILLEVAALRHRCNAPEYARVLQHHQQQQQQQPTGAGSTNPSPLMGAMTPDGLSPRAAAPAGTGRTLFDSPLMTRQSSVEPDGYVPNAPPAIPNAAPPVLIVSGGGGAFMHGTHLPTGKPIRVGDDRVPYVRVNCYPPEHVSRRYALLNIFGFRKRNWRFDIFGGLLYWLTVVSMFPLCNLSHIVQARTWTQCFVEYWWTVGAVSIEVFDHSIVSLCTVCAMMIATVSFTNHAWPLWKRLLVGLQHGTTHFFGAIGILVLMETLLEAGLEKRVLGVESLYDSFVANWPAARSFIEEDLAAYTWGAAPKVLRFLTDVFDVPTSLAVFKTALCKRLVPAFPFSPSAAAAAALAKNQCPSSFTRSVLNAASSIAPEPALGFIQSLYTTATAGTCMSQDSLTGRSAFYRQFVDAASGSGGGLSDSAHFVSGAALTASLPRLHMIMYYTATLLYFWLLATPVVSFVFGTYLWLSVSYLKDHWNEAFSSLRLDSYKVCEQLLALQAPPRVNCETAFHLRLLMTELSSDAHHAGRQPRAFRDRSRKAASPLGS